MRGASTRTARPQGLLDTKVGTFPQALYDEAKNQGWVVISMKDDWKRVFAFEPWDTDERREALPNEREIIHNMR